MGDRQRQQVVTTFVKLDVGAPSKEPRRRGNDDERFEELEERMREILGDEGFESLQRLMKQRDGFKTELANAINSGLSRQRMAEFLNGHAFLWAHLYENAERDPQFMAMIERALTLCANYVPEYWYQAVKDVDENREH